MFDQKTTAAIDEIASLKKKKFSDLMINKKFPTIIN